MTLLIDIVCEIKILPIKSDAWCFFTVKVFVKVDSVCAVSILKMRSYH